MKYITLFLMAFLLQIAPMLAQQGNEEKLAEQYYLDKEYESALEMYDKLYKKEPKVNYANRIVACYEMMRKFTEATEFLDKATKRQPEIVTYPVMKAGIWEKTGKMAEAEKLYEDIITKNLKSEGDFLQVGSYLYKTGKLEIAEKCYVFGRKALKNSNLYCSELANIFDQQGMYEKATQEYLNQYYNDREDYANSELAILNMVGNVGADDAVEKVLLKEVGNHEGDLGIRQILYEFFVMQKNFVEAFIQVKSIDKFFREDGERIYKFAETMRNNKNYELSNKAYDYLITNKEGSPYYYQAFIEKATNGELRAFEQIPPDMNAIREAVASYSDLLSKFGKKTEYFNAIYRRANLQVFYLNELDVPLADLREITANPPSAKFNRDEWAKGKLLVGDILLMKQDYNNAKLTYAEIADAFKDRQTGALAKFRLAQMAYYKGDFEMAGSLLSVIKDNTSNDISNDAIQLNLKIIDNTGLDTTLKPLEIYANAELLIYQRHFDEAMTILDSLMYRYPNHSLTDEILWAKANIYLKRNEIPKTLELLDRILEKYKEDIYGDDALFTKARLYDYNLKDEENAKKYYLEFLSAYPGSLFSVEVRKRIRELRKEG
jgi:tetratricopeptide (TPR) repeat protein